MNIDTSQFFRETTDRLRRRRGASTSMLPCCNAFGLSKPSCAARQPCSTKGPAGDLEMSTAMPPCTPLRYSRNTDDLNVRDTWSKS